VTDDTDRSPQRDRAAFDCPHCGAYAKQSWTALGPIGVGRVLADPKIAYCDHCGRMNVWVGNEMVWPARRSGLPPHPDMPDDVRVLYDEARDTAARSPRSAAALLRLALQVLVNEVEPGSGDINTKIGALVKRGLDPQVQQAMDVVRVVGNNAVHPGQIDLDDDSNWLPALFQLLNLIVEQVVARPKQVAAMFQALPSGAQAAVAKRDATP
jgi:hypothetical protein